MSKLLNLFFRRNKTMTEVSVPTDSEFCPRCEANLTMQRAYRKDLPYWICKGCGEMLINPDMDSDVVWFCDGCGELLNQQKGFKDECGVWKCVLCGYENKIDSSALYMSENEYQIDLNNPYKGMKDSDLISLMEYEEIESLNDREEMILVKDKNGNLYVKKILHTYDTSVYQYLLKFPIKNMPQIKEVFEGNQCLIIIEEYIMGKTLAEIIEQQPLESNKAIRYAMDVCKIVKNLHNQATPIIHRDIKPSNVMITKDDKVYLLDVNVAKWYHSEEKEDTNLLGTLYYAAPEQFGYGFVSSSEKTDIYGIGILLNVMITGKMPKEEKASGEMWNIIEKCIRLNYEERYTDDELIEVLKNILEAYDAGNTNR